MLQRLVLVPNAQERQPLRQLHPILLYKYPLSHNATAFNSAKAQNCQIATPLFFVVRPHVSNTLSYNKSIFRFQRLLYNPIHLFITFILTLPLETTADRPFLWINHSIYLAKSRIPLVAPSGHFMPGRCSSFLSLTQSLFLTKLQMAPIAFAEALVTLKATTNGFIAGNFMQWTRRWTAVKKWESQAHIKSVKLP